MKFVGQVFTFSPDLFELLLQSVSDLVGLVQLLAQLDVLFLVVV